MSRGLLEGGDLNIPVTGDFRRGKESCCSINHPLMHIRRIVFALVDSPGSQPLQIPKVKAHADESDVLLRIFALEVCVGNAVVDRQAKTGVFQHRLSREVRSVASKCVRLQEESLMLISRVMLSVAYLCWPLASSEAFSVCVYSAGSAEECAGIRRHLRAQCTWHVINLCMSVESTH